MINTFQSKPSLSGYFSNEEILEPILEYRILLKDVGTFFAQGIVKTLNPHHFFHGLLPIAKGRHNQFRQLPSLEKPKLIHLAYRKEKFRSM